MSSQKIDSHNQKKVTLERRLDMHNLMRSYIVHECKRLQIYKNHKDLEKEVDNRLAVLLS